MAAFRHAVADARAAAGRGRQRARAPRSTAPARPCAGPGPRSSWSRSALSRGDHDDLVDTIRIARRGLSAARDLDVAPATLDGLPLAETDRATADALVASMRAAAPSTDDLAAAIDDAVSRLTAAADALDAALPPALDDSTFAKGLAATYRPPAARSAGPASRGARSTPGGAGPRS